MKESINTKERIRLRNEFEINDVEDFNNPEKSEKPEFLAELGKFISTDFIDFRKNEQDNTVGAMIVCNINNQAKKMYEWFSNNSELEVALVISSEGSENDKKNKINQLHFKNYDSENPLDLLIVNRMLTTGYDVDRLKKLYLLRNPHTHSLLQTISRVNRPYKRPNGENYQYRYIVDFVDIAKEYESTLEEYLEELQQDFNRDGSSDETLVGLVVDKKYVYENYLSHESKLKEIVYDMNNLENFSLQLNNLRDELLYKIRKHLFEMRNCYMELLLSNNIEYLEKIPYDSIKKMLKLVQDRIKFINFKKKPVETLDETDEEETKEIFYEFIKVSIETMDLEKPAQIHTKVDKLWELINLIQKEIKSNQNKNDSKLLTINLWLQEILNKFDEFDVDEIDLIIDELMDVLKEIKLINKGNEEISSSFRGNVAFLRTYQYALDYYPEINKISLQSYLNLVYNVVKEVDTQILIKRGRINFINFVSKKTASELLELNIFNDVKSYYEPLLNEIFDNL